MHWITKFIQNFPCIYYTILSSNVYELEWMLTYAYTYICVYVNLLGKGGWVRLLMPSQQPMIGEEVDGANCTRYWPGWGPWRDHSACCWSPPPKRIIATNETSAKRQVDPNATTLSNYLDGNGRLKGVFCSRNFDDEVHFVQWIHFVSIIILKMVRNLLDVVKSEIGQ